MSGYALRSAHTQRLSGPFQTGSLPDEFWISVLTALGETPKVLTIQPGGRADSKSGQLFEEKEWLRPSPELCALRLTCRRFSNDLSALFIDLHVKREPVPAPAWAVRFSQVRRITVHVNKLDPVDLSWLQRSHARVLEEPAVTNTGSSSAGTCTGTTKTATSTTSAVGDITRAELVPTRATPVDESSSAVPVQRVLRAQVQQVTVQRSISSWNPEIANVARTIELPSRQPLDDDEPLGSLQEASSSARGGEAPSCCCAVQDTTVRNSIHLQHCIKSLSELQHWTREGCDIIPAAVTSLSLSIWCDVSPEAVASLLPRLQRLRKLKLIPAADLSDEHLVAIGASSAPELQVLIANRTRGLTDRGLMALAGIPSLTRIEMPCSSITAAGVKALKKLIPGVRVYR